VSECICGRWGEIEGSGGGVSVLGSLWVSQVPSGRESGRYLIVIASMERTEAGPVRKFLIYLVFLFSLLFLPSPTAPFCGEGWRKVKGGVEVLCAAAPVVVWRLIEAIEKHGELTQINRCVGTTL